MLTADYLKEIFAEKLHKTGSLDESFIKAWWIAFLKGSDIGYEKGFAAGEAAERAKHMETLDGLKL